MSFEHSRFKEDIYYGMPHEPIKNAFIGITYPDSTYEIMRKDTKWYSIEYVCSGYHFFSCKRGLIILGKSL